MKISNIYYGGSLLLLPVLATARSIRSSSRTCKDYLIPVNVTAPVVTPIYPKFRDSYDSIAFFNSINRRDAKVSFVPFVFSGEDPVISFASATYNIAGTVCSPTNGGGKTLLVASHGLGYDRRYWDSQFESEKYNFVDFAISKGFSVFFYDRLGTGLSTKVPGYNEPQALVQLEILRQLTLLLRSGKFTGSLGVPSKIAHIGHSFGSFLSNTFVRESPELSDAAVFTGLGYYPGGQYLEAWSGRVASEAAPGKWPGRDKHYITWVDAFAHAATFFYPDTYSKKALTYAESIKQPVAAIELLTLQSFNLSAPAFVKPVMTISGEFDLLVCGGNCVGLVGESNKKDFFPNATDFQAVIHPGVGHGINLSYNATGAYKVVTDFLTKNGL